MSISQYLNHLFSTWTGVVQAFAFLAGITLIVVTAIVSRLAWGKILVSTIVAGFVIWAVTMNGLGWFSTSIGKETKALPAVSVTVDTYGLAA